MLEVAGVGLTGNVGSGEIELPALTVAGEGSRTSNVSLPALTVSAIGLNGRIGTANVSLPGLTVSGAASQIQSGSADGGIELPALEVVAVGLRGQIASASATLGLSVSAVGLTGTVATAAIELPMLTVDAAGYTSHTGSATITLPMLRVIGAASSPLPAVDADAGEAGSGTGLELAAGEALVLNLRNNAASTYDNYAFNSFATFNGVALGANADGIFALTGELDDTANIAATARMGVTDFNDAHLKRVSSAYVGYRTDGEAVLRVSVAEGEWFEYPLEDRDMDGAHGTRAKIGKGLKGRYWQAEVANVNGASLELDELELVPEKLSRRLG